MPLPDEPLIAPPLMPLSMSPEEPPLSPHRSPMSPPMPPRSPPMPPW